MAPMPSRCDALRAPRHIPVWVDDSKYGDRIVGVSSAGSETAADPWRKQAAQSAGALALFLRKSEAFVRDAVVAFPHVSALVVERRPPVSQFDQMVEHLRHGGQLPHGLVCVAGSSEACHGYHGRGWSALEGNLHLSVHWTPRVAVAEYGAGLLALGAIACVSAVDELACKRGVAGIKWVNDVVVGRRKIAGVLAWAQSRGTTLDSVVLGIGLNVERVPEGVADAAVEGATALVDLRPSVKLADALGGVLRHLSYGYAALSAGRVEELVRRYRSRSVALGRQVRWVPDPGDSGTPVEGKAIEIGPDLALLLAGRSEPLRSGRIAML